MKHVADFVLSLNVVLPPKRDLNIEHVQYGSYRGDFRIMS